MEGELTGGQLRDLLEHEQALARFGDMPEPGPDQRRRESGRVCRRRGSGNRDGRWFTSEPENRLDVYVEFDG